MHYGTGQPADGGNAFLADQLLARTLQRFGHGVERCTQPAQLIAIGFVVSFLVGLVEVRYLLDFVSTRGFGLFAIWRILVGGAGLAWLTFAH